jgi:flagellar biosynthetic protein FliO
MDAIQPMAAVVLVLSLLAGSLFLLKKFRLPRRSFGGPRRMEVVERVTLGPHHALHLVRLGDRTMVIATAPSSCQLLCDSERDGHR